MMNDVYGGFTLGSLATEEPIGKISMRGMDANENKKKAAIREQQLALEQQIEEREDSKKKRKLWNEAEQERELAIKETPSMNLSREPSFCSGDRAEATGKYLGKGSTSCCPRENETSPSSKKATSLHHQRLKSI